MASAFAFPIAVWLGTFGILVQVVALAVVLALAGWSISQLVSTEGDAGWIVIDEAAGTFLAVIGLTWAPALIAVVVFRAADIFKGAFPGVSAAENRPGVTGVIGDDLVAGVYGLVAGLAAATWLF